MSYDEDYKLNSKAEEYLQENYGNLGSYYNAIGVGTYFRQAFQRALSTPDLVRLRMSGRLSNLMEITQDNKVDDEVVLDAIEYLESTRSEYPESHPIWKTR